MLFIAHHRPAPSLVENAPWVGIVVLLVNPKNNEETNSCRSLLQLFVAASFIQHHAFAVVRVTQPLVHKRQP